MICPQLLFSISSFIIFFISRFASFNLFVHRQRETWEGYTSNAFHKNGNWNGLRVIQSFAFSNPKNIREHCLYRSEAQLVSDEEQ